MECDKCKFCKIIKSPDRDAVAFVGECRRFPPKQDGKGVHTIDEFPTISLDGWCGEYKKGTKK